MAVRIPEAALTSARPIRVSLLLLVACGIVPSFLMVLALIWHVYDREQADLREESVATARAMTNAVDQQLASVQQGLSVLATSRRLREGNMAEFYAQAQEALQGLNVTNVLLVQPDGTQLLNTLVPFGAPLPNAGAAPLLQRIMQTRKPAVSDLIIGAVTGKPVLAVGVPVIQNGLVVYVLSAGMVPQRLQSILQQQRLPQDRITAIVDGRGTIVARTHDQARFIGMPVRPALFDRIKQVAEEVVESTTVDGIPVLSAFSRSTVSGWSVVIGIPRDSLTAELRRTMVWLGLGTLLVLAVTSALAWRLGNAIARSVGDLADAVGAMGRGQSVTIPKLSFREAADLGRAFEHATLLVQDAQATAADHEARLRVVLESALDAIILVDEKQRIALFNAAACQMFGYSAEEVIGAPIDILIPPRFWTHHAGLVEAFGKNLAEPRRMGSGRVVTGQRSDGTEFPVDASISAANAGGHRFYTVILRDITHAAKYWQPQPADKPE